MFDEAISLMSMCSSMNSWLTPTVLFLLLNLMIGTIAFTSAFSSPKPSPSHDHLQHQQQQQQQQQQQFYYQHNQQHHHQQQQQPQLITRSSSVLQRLKSINFNNLYTTFYSHPPPTHFHQPDPKPEPEPKPEQPKHTTNSTEKNNGDDNGNDDDNPSMDEVYNRILQSNQVSHYNRQNSDTKPSGGEIPVKLPQKMKKSASHKSAFNHFHLQPSPKVDDDDDDNGGLLNQKYVESVEEEEEERENGEGEGGVDAKADDFINKFKKQLQLQRNESIVRYKQMISRISAK